MSKTITRTKHSDVAWRQDNPALAEIDYLLFEASVRNGFDVYATNQKENFLELYTLSNGAFYLSLKQAEPIHLVNAMNSFEGEMSADAASICICILVLYQIIDQMMDSEKKQVLRRKYTDLWHYVDQHDEVSEMRRFLD